MYGFDRRELLFDATRSLPSEEFSRERQFAEDRFGWSNGDRDLSDIWRHYIYSATTCPFRGTWLPNFKRTYWSPFSISDKSEWMTFELIEEVTIMLEKKLCRGRNCQVIPTYLSKDSLEDFTRDQLQGYPEEAYPSLATLYEDLGNGKIRIILVDSEYECEERCKHILIDKEKFDVKGVVKIMTLRSPRIQRLLR